MSVKTRIYEVTATLPIAGGATTKTIPFLVDAKSQSAAERHVARKYIKSPATLPSGKRIAELMGPDHKIIPEQAEEES